MPVSISRISLLVAWLGLLAATTAPAGVAKTPSKGELTVCKFAGPGVEIGKRFRFTANGRSFRLAAKSKSKAGCTTLAFEPGATVRLRERLPANTRVAISAKPAAALVSSDAVKGAAVLRLRRGKTTVRYTNVVCDEAAEMNGVEPVIPKDATEVGPLVDVDIDRGPLSSVYPGVDTTTDDFYPLPCDPSIGGTLPPEVDDPPSQAEIDLKAELDKFENAEGPGILKALQQSPIAPPPVPTLPGGECLFKDGKTTKVVPCDSKLFLHNDQPFAGRDIIYVHGLALDHLKNRIGNYGPAFKQWPADASEFLNPAGYYRQFAEKYWAPHIEENLYDPFLPFGSAAGWQWTASDPVPKYQRKSNRYLVVAWSSNQTLEYAQHALLTQIQLAIASNTNVVTPPQYPKTDVRPFCSNGCMIVSHSAGSLAIEHRDVACHRRRLRARGQADRAAHAGARLVRGRHLRKPAGKYRRGGRAPRERWWRALGFVRRLRGVGGHAGRRLHRQHGLRGQQHPPRPHAVRRAGDLGVGGRGLARAHADRCRRTPRGQLRRGHEMAAAGPRRRGGLDERRVWKPQPGLPRSHAAQRRDRHEQREGLRDVEVPRAAGPRDQELHQPQGPPGGAPGRLRPGTSLVGARRTGRRREW